MHVYSVPPAAVCIKDVLREISSQKAMHAAHRLNVVNKYKRLLRAGARIDVAPIRVRQNSVGYLEALNRTDLFVNSYVIACYQLGQPIEVKTRKPLRPIGQGRLIPGGPVLSIREDARA